MDWYYAGKNGRQGPVNEDAFIDLVRSGAIGESTLVWNVSLPDWIAYGSLHSAATPAPAALSAGPVYCSHCGRSVASAADLVLIAGREVCGACKPALLQQMRETGSPWAPAANYAGFWIRFAAIMIDTVILTVINVALTAAAVGWTAVNEPSAAAAVFLLSYASALAVGIAYEGFFLVNKGATLGKLALGLRVIRPSGEPITWGTAIGRYFGKMVSGMILGIGFLMAIWDPEKRTLHDRMVNTRVVKV